MLNFIKNRYLLESSDFLMLPFWDQFQEHRRKQAWSLVGEVFDVGGFGTRPYIVDCFAGCGCFCKILTK
jgi:hypothetical protein